MAHTMSVIEIRDIIYGYSLLLVDGNPPEPTPKRTKIKSAAIIGLTKLSKSTEHGATKKKKNENNTRTYQ